MSTETEIKIERFEQLYRKTMKDDWTFFALGFIGGVCFTFILIMVVV